MINKIKKNKRLVFLIALIVFISAGLNRSYIQFHYKVFSWFFAVFLIILISLFDINEKKKHKIDKKEKSNSPIDKDTLNKKNDRL
jgi:hypothetical protein